MKKSNLVVLAGAAVLGSGLVWAKEGVQNPAVKDRMDLMQSIASSAKDLGDMASGKAAFDPDAASQAIGGLVGNANLITDKFEPQEDDPVSEARPDIWTNWDDFGSKADGLFKAATAADVSSLGALQASMGNIGGACKACHSTYKD